MTKTTINDLMDFDDDEELLEYINDLEEEHEALSSSLLSCTGRMNEMIAWGVDMRKADCIWSKTMDALVMEDQQATEMYLSALINIREHCIINTPSDILVKISLDKEENNYFSGNDTIH